MKLNHFSSLFKDFILVKSKTIGDTSFEKRRKIILSFVAELGFPRLIVVSF